MASYQNAAFLKAQKSAAFDKLHKPSTPAPNAGIYRCAECGHEIGTAKHHKLPPETHPMHPEGKPILWQLVVFAIHKKEKKEKT